MNNGIERLKQAGYSLLRTSFARPIEHLLVNIPREQVTQTIINQKPETPLEVLETANNVWLTRPEPTLITTSLGLGSSALNISARLRYDQPAENKLRLVGRFVTDMSTFYWPLAALTLWASISNRLEGSPPDINTIVGAGTIAVIGLGRTVYAGYQHISDALNHYNLWSYARQAKLDTRQDRLANDPKLQEARSQQGLLEEYLAEQQATERKRIGLPAFLARRAGQKTGSWIPSEKPEHLSELPPFMDRQDQDPE